MESLNEEEMEPTMEGNCLPYVLSSRTFLKRGWTQLPWRFDAELMAKYDRMCTEWRRSRGKERPADLYPIKICLNLRRVELSHQRCIRLCQQNPRTKSFIQLIYDRSYYIL
ncbi:hypothetical protein Ciccas_011747 [Cichlidogyrus casuarinus]|uniref:Uncharacterized protein n=1 Tax=Cichlidogyrus casuarinus TaxID=1844966 RepID=A0ABD2PQE5_9PLAT